MKRAKGLAFLALLLVVVLLPFAGCTAEPEDPKETAKPTGPNVENTDFSFVGNITGLQYPSHTTDDIILNKPTAAKTIYVVKASLKGLDGKAMNLQEKLLLQSVQGIVAQTRAELYIGSASEKFLKEAVKQYGLTLDDGKYVYTLDANGEIQKSDSSTTWLSDLGSIVNHYAEEGIIKGYVKIRCKSSRYSEKDNQSNQGCTIAGVCQYVVVAEDKEEAFQAACPTVTLGKDISTIDVTQYDIFKEYEAQLNKDGLIMQAAPRLENLREYGISQKYGFYFYNQSDPEKERDYIYSSLNPMANAYGWEQVDVSEGGVAMGMREDPAVDFASDRGVNTFAADWCSNLSIWMSMPQQEFKQTDYKKLSTDEEQVHYVTMLYSDGDNIQWTTQSAGFTDGYYLSTKANKKEMPFGWTLTASMAEVAPSSLQYIYQNMTDIESFVCSVSGYSYSHPARFNDEELALFARNTGVMMDKAGMDLIAMKGVNERVMNAFSEQPEIEGGFVMYGCDSGKPGHIYWANGKPFVHDRYIFWKDSGDGRNPELIAKTVTKLRHLSTDKAQSNCYSFIQVHCWSYKYREVQKLFYDEVSQCSDVKVVTPAELIDLIKKNVTPEEQKYTK